MAAALLLQLQRLLAEVVFPPAFGDSLRWDAVHRFECPVSRRGRTIRVEAVTFWTSETGDGTALTFDARDAEWQRAVCAYLTHAALTAATQTEGDVSCIIGYAPTRKEIDAIMGEHVRNGFEAGSTQPVDMSSQVRGKGRRAGRRASRRAR